MIQVQKIQQIFHNNGININNRYDKIMHILKYKSDNIENLRDYENEILDI